MDPQGAWTGTEVIPQSLVHQTVPIREALAPTTNISTLHRSQPPHKVLTTKTTGYTLGPPLT